MNHDECQDLLIDHHYAELAPKDHRAVAEHLSTCAECALEYCRLRADLEGFDVLGEDTPRATVRTALRRRVVAEFPPRWRDRFSGMLAKRIPIYQPAIALALIVAVVAIVWPVDYEHVPEAATVLEHYDSPNLRVVDDRIL